MRGISQAELARASGISQAFISKIEDFGKLPGEDTLEKISYVLGFPRNFFFRPGRILDLPAFHFRKRAKLAARPLAKIKAVANIQQQHVEKLLKSYEMKNVRVVPHIDLDETGLNPEKVAEYLRQYWLVERGPIRNIVELIEEAGGIIIFSDFETKLFDGLSLRQEGMPPVFLMNKNVPGDRLRFSLAHELGHMIMHNEPDLNKEEKEREEEANRFAAAFLMPATDIKPYLANARIADSGRVKAYWKVSIKALIKRSYDLKFMTASQYKFMNIQYAKFFKDGEPVEIAAEKPLLMKKIIDFHCNELEYSPDELAEFLAIGRKEMEDMYFEVRPGIKLVVSN